MSGTSMLIADLEDFTDSHRPHGQLFAEAGPPGANGYRLEIRCRCGVLFERWVTPEDAAIDLALLARWELTFAASHTRPSARPPAATSTSSAAQGPSRLSHSTA